VANNTQASWEWLEKNPLGDLDGSTLTKMFRNGNLSPTACLAREAVQNSSDAATRFKQDHPGENLNLRVVFRFVELIGPQKSEMVDNLGLHELKKRTEVAKDFREQPVGPSTSLDHLEDPNSPLTLLYVEDYSTHGLFGHPVLTSDSIMYRAMLAVGDSAKSKGAGGSYGFGKSALVGVSKVKSIVAHTAFEPVLGDPSRTRLLGVTWWPSHKFGAANYGGRAIFAGVRTAEKPINPFEDQEADELAKRLGFQPRSVDNLNQLGTSFMLVDPLVDPKQLVDELAIWWWPALEDHMFDLEVVLPDGTVLLPRPATLPAVKQFFTAYRIAKKEQEPQDINKEQLASSIWRNTNGAGGAELGGLGLVVEDDAVTMDGEATDGTAIVALMRDPRMIVRYQHYKQRIPLRGVFVASSQSNDLLRQTEPSDHDAWSTDASTDVDKKATLTAAAVADKIRRSVSKMAKDVVPPPPRTPRALSHFAKLMSGFVGGQRGPAKSRPKGSEPIELQFPQGVTLKAVGEEEVVVSSVFSVRIADIAPQSECQVTVKCELHVTEDENPNGGLLPVRIAPEGNEHGFTEEGDGVWSGILTKIAKVRFSATSDPYSNLWTTTLQPTVTVDWSNDDNN
jgi:hypothetical protein